MASMAMENESPVPSGTPLILKRKRIRLLTADRRKQNREAQRRYRDRRKQAQTTGSSITDDHLGFSLVEDSSVDATADLSSLAKLDASAAGKALNFDDSMIDFFGFFDDTTPGVCSGFDDGLEPWPSPKAYPTPTGSITCDEIRRNQDSRLPPQMRGLLQLQRLSFHAAHIQNALHIGLPLFLAGRQNTMSPWYWNAQFMLIYHNGEETDPQVSATIPRPTRNDPCFILNFGASSDLAPTSLQSSHPHSMYLDMIPFPIFRDRVITLLSMDPPAFDEAELRRDIEDDGLVVWGVGYGNTESNAALVKDHRNWEASMAFLKKWRLLVHQSGLDDQSEWWRRMRGEG